MASQVYNSAIQGIMKGDIDLNGDDIRCRLLNATTTCDTENDGITNIADFTTVGVSTDTGYSDQALASEAVNLDDANDRAEFDADDVSFTLNGDGAGSNYPGVLIYKYVDGTDANDIVIAYIEFDAVIALTATQIDIPWDAEGIIQGTRTSGVYNAAIQSIMSGDIDLDGDDIRIALLASTTTCDTENDGITNLADFTTLGESDDTGYSRQALTTEAVNLDDANDRAEFDADDASFSLNGDGGVGSNYVGVLLYKYVDGTAANDIAIGYIAFSSTIALTATSISIPWDAEGILQGTRS